MLRQEKCCCYRCWCLACRRWVCWWSVLWLCSVNAEAACVCCWRMLFLCMQMLRLLMTCAVDLHADAACVVDVCCCCSPCLATHLRRYWKVIAFLNFTALHLSFQKLYCFNDSSFLRFIYNHVLVLFAAKFKYPICNYSCSELHNVLHVTMSKNTNIQSITIYCTYKYC